MPNRFAYPRPEYPRPDRQRGTSEGTDWLNLNGPWQFRFDGEARGAEEKWFDEQGDWREQIIVPFCWESLAAWGDGDSAGNDNYYSTRVFKNPLEVTRANHRSAPRYEIGWYRRRVTIPSGEAWAGKRAIRYSTLPAGNYARIIAEVATGFDAPAHADARMQFRRSSRRAKRSPGKR